MKDDQIDGLFEPTPQIPVALAEKIRAHIQRDTRPVEPMMSGGVYVLLIVAICAAMSILFAAILGFKGLHVLSQSTSMELLIVLSVLALSGGMMVARSMRPGSGSLHSWLLGILAFAAYEVLVLTLFRDYSMTLFVERGIVCLALGVLCAAFTALPIWLVVRQGFVVDTVRAGAVIGLVSGLAGLTALTLHCPVITTPHAGVWHAAVVVVCVGLGSVVGRISHRC